MFCYFQVLTEPRPDMRQSMLCAGTFFILSSDHERLDNVAMPEHYAFTRTYIVSLHCRARKDQKRSKCVIDFDNCHFWGLRAKRGRTQKSHRNFRAQWNSRPGHSFSTSLDCQENKFGRIANAQWQRHVAPIYASLLISRASTARRLS
jgi:hypothetical protein